MAATQLGLWGSPQPVGKTRRGSRHTALPDVVVPDAPIPEPNRLVPESAFSHQRAGVGWLGWKVSGILADECGLGKTLQACVAADAPIVVVCPAVMREDWAREMNRWRPDLRVKIVMGTNPLDRDSLAGVDVVIINYDILSKHVDELSNIRIATLIGDEAHYLCSLKPTSKKKRKKNPDVLYEGSDRAKAFAKLAHSAERKFLLTATPVMNRPIEIWPLLHYLDPNRWHDYIKFGCYFCDGKLEKIPVRGKRTKEGKPIFRKTWNFEGSSNERKLHRVLMKDYMLRRTKAILDLPEKTRRTMMISLDEPWLSEYVAAEEDFAQWVEKNGGSEALRKHLAAPDVTKLVALRRLAAMGKLTYAKEWAVRHFEGTGRPLIVMAHHRDVTLGFAQMLSETVVRFPDGDRPVRVGKIVGGMTDNQRTADKDAFQRGELDVIVCSLQAAGVGLTLTAASETLFLERAWRPADLVQAEDRCHRIGQKNKVMITYLDAAGTIDQAVSSLLVDKQSTVAAIVDGENLSEQDAVRHVFGVLCGLHRKQSVRQRAFQW